jgi:hypothetical protein
MKQDNCINYVINYKKIVSTSNQRVKIIATENTEITEDFFSVSSVAININNDLYKFYYPTL